MQNSFVLHGDLCYAAARDKLITQRGGYLVCVAGLSQGVFAQCPEEFRHLPQYDYADQLIIPGLTDLHMHAPQFSFRSVGLDMELLDQHFAALSRGEEIIIPKFEFARQMRNDARGTPLKLGKNEIAIFEGIHALNDDIAGPHPEAAKLYISARSNVNDGAALRFKGTWMRLTRRAVRDYSFRGTGVADTLEMWANVRRGEKLYISPYKNRADIIFDSSLPYEVSVMKNFALPLLQAVPEENARRGELLELIEAFQWFEPIDPELVPVDSLLREFIGGGSYKYH